MKLRPYDYRIALQRANAYNMVKSFSLATTDLISVLSFNPNLLEALLMQSRIHLSQGKVSQAIEVIFRHLKKIK